MGWRVSLWLLPLFVLGIIGGAALGAQISLDEKLRILKSSYRGIIVSVDGGKVVFAGAKSLIVDDGAQKSHQQKLKNGDIEDMLSQIYPLGSCAAALPRQNFDPGRIRSGSFFRAIYGATKAAAQRNLTSIDWFGRKLPFTTIGGADKALLRVRGDLAKLGPEFRKYFLKTAGTFNWRVIAGTKRLSVHSFGAAIDLDTRFADYWRWAGGKPGAVPAYRNKLPLKIVAIFERHGFVWGGRWYHFDTGHFEYRPELIALGKAALERGCTG